MLHLPKTLALSLAVLALFQGTAPVEKKLQGTWEVVSIVSGGNAVPELQKEGKLTFHFEGDKLTVKLGDKVMNEGTCKSNPSSSPKTIDLIDGKEREVVFGIYEVKENEARLCMGMRGKERPKEFSAEAGTTQSLVTLKRVK